MRVGNFLLVGVDTILRDDATQDVDSRGSDPVSSGESFRLWRRKRAKKTARVATLLMGELFDTIVSRYI